MLKNASLNRFIVENILWFLGSLVLAFFVWVVALSQLDPVMQWRLAERVPIRLTPDAGLTITNRGSITDMATVVVRAPTSVRQLLAADDIVVWADLTGLGPGSHVVELEWSVVPERRARVVDISPRQITVELEEIAERLVPVRLLLTGNLPAGYTQAEEAVLDVNQVLVRGPASLVDQVVTAQVEISLNEQREVIDDDFRLIAVDADDNPVANVTLDPQVVGVRVNIRRIGS